MCLPRYLTFLVCLLVPGLALGQEPKPIWENLLRDLESPRFREREKASQELEKLGAKALPGLVAALKNGGSESSTRAQAIIEKFANSQDKALQAATLKSVKELVDVPGALADSLRSLLNAKRRQAIAIFRDSGLEFYADDEDRILHLDLDYLDEPQLVKVLPLLQEFPELQRLSISNRRFTSKMMVHLETLVNLERINLFDSSVGDKGLMSLLKLKKLKDLPIGYTHVTDEGLKTLGQMTQLRYLGLRGNNVTDRGMKHLAQLTNLEGMYLGETLVSDAGFQVVKNFPNLSRMYLEHMSLTDEGLSAISVLKQLETVMLSSDTATSKQKRDQLQELVPGLQILVLERR